MSSAQSVRFDRAAGYYDRTRSLAAPTMQRIIPVLRAQLDRYQPCLEIGVGTGRIALPLHEERVAMVGLDLSAPMLTELVAKARGAPFPLMVADASRLPLADQSVGAALVVHVLHLIPDWQRVVDELIRVVRSGGRIVVDMGGFAEGPWQEVTSCFAEHAGLDVRGPGAREPEAVDTVMRARGASVRVLDAVTETRSSSFNKGIKLFEDGLLSFTWSASPEVRAAAAAATRGWARAKFGDLDATFDYELQIVYRVYDLP
jgi:SAM-dependent methyltransferase